MFSQKAKRAKRWSAEEVDALVEGIRENAVQIFGCYSLTVTKNSKRQAWEKVTEKVNAVNISGEFRTTAQVDHKWYDVKSAAKKKVSEYKREIGKTGGGIRNVQEPTEMDFKIISLIGPEAVEGIPGSSGTEWLAKSSIPPSPSTCQELESSSLLDELYSSQPFEPADDVMAIDSVLPYSSYLEPTNTRPQGARSISPASSISAQSISSRSRKGKEEKVEIVNIQQGIYRKLEELVSIQNLMQKSLERIAEKL